MYDYLSGKLVKKQATEVVLDVNGVGYGLKVSLSTAEQLPEEGEQVQLKTYLHVREDVLQLYGFANEDEREIFKALISISGVGPKLAQTILSGMTPAKLLAAIRNKDEKQLHAISGVGKKTAQRLIVELKDKSVVIHSGMEQTAESPSVAFGALENEAMMALISLGYRRAQAEKAIAKVMAKGDHPLTTEELIKEALKTI